MRLVPVLDHRFGRRDRWQTLGVVFDRPFAQAGGPPGPHQPRRVAWFPGLVRPASRPRPRRFGH